MYQLQVSLQLVVSTILLAALTVIMYVHYVVGLTCFQAFFSFPEMQPLLKHFCVYHVSSPGQRDNAPLIYFG